MGSQTINSYPYLIFLVSLSCFLFSSFFPESSLAETVYDKHEFCHYIKGPWHRRIYCLISLYPIMIKSIVHFVAD